MPLMLCGRQEVAVTMATDTCPALHPARKNLNGLKAKKKSISSNKYKSKMTALVILTEFEEDWAGNWVISFYPINTTRLVILRTKTGKNRRMEPHWYVTSSSILLLHLQTCCRLPVWRLECLLTRRQSHFETAPNVADPLPERAHTVGSG